MSNRLTPSWSADIRARKCPSSSRPSSPAIVTAWCWTAEALDGSAPSPISLLTIAYLYSMLCAGNRPPGPRNLLASALRDQIDIAYPYDPATIHVIWVLEQLGTNSRATSRRSLMSYCHPGVGGTLLAVIEAVRQLRGGRGDRQV